MGKSVRLAPFFCDLAAIFREQYRKCATDHEAELIECMVADVVETYSGLSGFDHHAFIEEVYRDKET